jgi:predicted ribosome-associated RNA-binding protein Tma20
VNAAEAQIRAKVRVVVADERQFGVLSTGERIAIALVLDRPDLLQRAWGTIAEAVHRLGDEWTRAALRVQRDGWDGPA